jgi:hypothetical protein
LGFAASSVLFLNFNGDLGTERLLDFRIACGAGILTALHLLIDRGFNNENPHA